MFEHQLCEFLSFRSRVPLQTQNRLQHTSVSITQTTTFLHEVMRTSAGNKGFTLNPQLTALWLQLERTTAASVSEEAHIWRLNIHFGSFKRREYCWYLAQCITHAYSPTPLTWALDADWVRTWNASCRCDPKWPGNCPSPQLETQNKRNQDLPPIYYF